MKVRIMIIQLSAIERQIHKATLQYIARKIAKIAKRANVRAITNCRVEKRTRSPLLETDTLLPYNNTPLQRRTSILFYCCEKRSAYRVAARSRYMVITA